MHLLSVPLSINSNSNGHNASLYIDKIEFTICGSAGGAQCGAIYRLLEWLHLTLDRYLVRSYVCPDSAQWRGGVRAQQTPADRGLLYSGHYQQTYTASDD